MKITIKELMSTLSLERATAKKMYGLLFGTIDSSNVEELSDYAYRFEHNYVIRNENVMTAIDALIGSHGIEVIEGNNISSSSRWVLTCAIYCNTGDTYNATILYDTQQDKFYLTTMGDFVEKYSERYGIV